MYVAFACHETDPTQTNETGSQGMTMNNYKSHKCKNYMYKYM